MIINRKALAAELNYQMSRSGGKGGQNVNKVATKVEAGFSINASMLFNDEQKAILYLNLANRLTKEGFIKISSEKERSQLLNKQHVIEKMAHLLENALKVKKARKASKPTKASIEKRLNNKQRTALKKIERNKSKWWLLNTN